ncbi:endolytic transglycosylase MltG [Rheinheimera marina]|uniref:Endolytic murein transglycosylase n=1 Tax=Rheinheimera marina TaxID=1774958 RepID=A0ABV9JQH9_9GAMM
MIRAVVVALLVGLVSAFGAWNSWQAALKTQVQFNDPYVEVKAGDTALKLCRNWLTAGQLAGSSCRWLSIYLRFHPELSKLHQGVYKVQPRQSVLSVLQLFASGKVAQFSVALKEGETLKQNLQRLAQSPYLNYDLAEQPDLSTLLSWPDDWGPAPELAEAMVFAETYHYTANSKASDLLKRAHQLLLERLKLAWEQRLTDLPYQTPYQLLIMASIVEKESGHEPEKPLVSSVFVNRLKLKMKLQTDPTVIYGLGDSFNGDITRADLKNPHPYNTYQHFGLPPGPIALPSYSSMLAAARPAASDWLYFVAKGDGTHQFSRTLAEHNAAVQKYIFGKN